MNNIHYYSLFFSFLISPNPPGKSFKTIQLFTKFGRRFLISNEITSIEQAIARKRYGNGDDCGSRVRKLSFFLYSWRKLSQKLSHLLRKKQPNFCIIAQQQNEGKKIKEGTLVETAAIRHNVSEWFVSLHMVIRRSIKQIGTLF